MSTPVIAVREMMTSPPITVRPDASVAEIIETLVRNRIRGVPVADVDGRLVGIVTEADLVLSTAYGKDDSRALALVAEMIQGRPAGWVDRVHSQTAASLMTRDLTTVTADDDVTEACRRMLRRRCGQLPVVDGERVVGVFSRHDALRALQCRASSDTQREPAPPTTVVDLERPNCLRLLSEHDLGRVGYLLGDEAMVLPVNYAVDDGLIVFRSDPGEKLSEVPMRRVVFEIDGTSPTGAWSVVARGHARDVTTALGASYDRLRAIPISRRAPGAKEHWIAIEITEVTGRRFS
jgi:CBS domain-containing protein